MVKKAAGLFSVVLASSVALAACGNATAEDTSNKGTDSKSASTSSGLADEQVLNLLEASEIPSMDTAKATDQVSFIVMNNVYEGLYRLGEGDKLEEGVAASHDVSEDGKTFTFHLREDAKWSNGNPVTANDFVYAWQRALDPATASEYAYIMYDIKNAEKVNSGELGVEELGVKAVDDYTLEVQLENAVPYFAELTVFGTFMPLNQAYVESQGENFALEADTAIYNGPFVLAEWKHEEGWQYQKNDQYWDKDNVKLDEINVNIVKTTATAVNLYETGKADRTGLTAEFVDKYRSDSNFATELDPSVYFLRLNEGVEELQNVNLRKAIAMSFDKQGLADVILNNGSIPANGLLPKEFVSSPDGVDFREENGELLTYDKEQAKEYWEKAKEELGVDEITLEILTYDNDSAKQLTEFLQQEIETNLEGVKIEIKQQPFKQKLELETNGDYQISFAGWGPDYPDPMTFSDMFVTDGSHNQMSYSNAEYDQLIADAKGSLLSDLNARWDALLQSEQILMEEAAIAPVYQRGVAYVQQPYVKGIASHSFGGDYSYKWAYIESH